MAFYEAAARHSEHDYGEYVEKINFCERARKDIGDKKLYEGIKTFLIEHYEDQIDSARRRRKVKQKTKEVVSPRLRGPTKFPSKFKGKAGSELLVKEAIEHGYIRHIKLNVPWHPAIFSDPSKLTTYPHQHTAAVLYRAVNRYIIQKKDYLEKSNYHKEINQDLESVEELYNAESIFKTGFIEPGLFHDDVEDRADEGEKFDKRWAVFLTATHYWGKDLVLEAEIPTNLIGFNLQDGIAWEIDDWFEEYGEPKRIKESGDEQSMAGMKQVILANKLEEKGEPHLPMKFVNGIHDDELAGRAGGNMYHFYPVKKYVRKMYKRDSEKYPHPSECNLQRMDRDSLAHTFRRSEDNSEIKFDQLQIDSRSVKKEMKLLSRLVTEMDVSGIDKLAKLIAEAKAKDFSSRPMTYWVTSWKVIGSFNRDLISLEEDYDGRLNVSIGDYPSRSLKELIRSNYFENINSERKQTVDTVRNNIKKIHEVCEGKMEGDLEKISEESLNLIQEFCNELVLVKINRETIKTILRLHNIREEPKRKKFASYIEKGLLEHTES